MDVLPAGSAVARPDAVPRGVRVSSCVARVVGVSRQGRGAAKRRRTEEEPPAAPATASAAAAAAAPATPQLSDAGVVDVEEAEETEELEGDPTIEAYEGMMMTHADLEAQLAAAKEAMQARQDDVDEARLILEAKAVDDLVKKAKKDAKAAASAAAQETRSAGEEVDEGDEDDEEIDDEDGDSATSSESDVPVFFREFECIICEGGKPVKVMLTPKEYDIIMCARNDSSRYVASAVDKEVTLDERRRPNLEAIAAAKKSLQKKQTLDIAAIAAAISHHFIDDFMFSAKGVLWSWTPTQKRWLSDRDRSMKHLRREAKRCLAADFDKQPQSAKLTQGSFLTSLLGHLTDMIPHQRAEPPKQAVHFSCGQTLDLGRPMLGQLRDGRRGDENIASVGTKYQLSAHADEIETLCAAIPFTESLDGELRDRVLAARSPLLRLLRLALDDDCDAVFWLLRHFAITAMCAAGYDEFVVLLGDNTAWLLEVLVRAFGLTEVPRDERNTATLVDPVVLGRGYLAKMPPQPLTGTTLLESHATLLRGAKLVAIDGVPARLNERLLATWVKPSTCSVYFFSAAAPVVTDRALQGKMSVLRFNHTFVPSEHQLTMLADDLWHFVRCLAETVQTTSTTLLQPRPACVTTETEKVIVAANESLGIDDVNLVPEWVKAKYFVPAASFADIAFRGEINAVLRDMGDTDPKKHMEMEDYVEKTAHTKPKGKKDKYKKAYWDKKAEVYLAFTLPPVQMSSSSPSDPLLL